MRCVTTDARLDSHFTTLDVSAIEDVALSQCRRAGASYATVRLHQVRSRVVHLRDLELETAVDHRDLGVGIRVIVGAPGVSRRPVGWTPTRFGMRPDEHVSWPSNAHVLAVRRSASHTNRRPRVFTSRTTKRIPSLSRWTRWPGFCATSANCSRRASTIPVPLWSAPWRPPISPIWRDPGLATTLADPAGVYRGAAHRQRFRRHVQYRPPVGRGWEYCSSQWDRDDELASLPALLAEKTAAPSVEPGRYDLVIDPTNLWLTIHESVGHATEKDRALGYEANYAGTSFATPDQLGTLRYGSPLMNVTADRTVPTGCPPSDGTTRAWPHNSGIWSATVCSWGTNSTARWPARQPIERVRLCRQRRACTHSTHA